MNDISIGKSVKNKDRVVINYKHYALIGIDSSGMLLYYVNINRVTKLRSIELKKYPRGQLLIKGVDIYEM